VAHDGGIFAFGNAAFHGSMSTVALGGLEVVGIAPTPTGAGYWMVAGEIQGAPPVQTGVCQFCITLCQRGLLQFCTHQAGRSSK
jgi:hypothetical protein